MITNIQKKLLIVISILTVFMIFVAANLYLAIHVNPEKLNVVYKTLEDEKIPEELNDLSIVYFTDLEYGKYETIERAQKLFDQINALQPDVIIFGGDLYDQEAQVTDQSNQELANFLSSIEAPLGKFAVYGETDLNDETRLNAINWIYGTSQVEVLNDTSVRLSNQSSSYIKIIGLGLNPNIDQVVSSINSQEYNLLISHYPDNLTNETVSASSISYAIAGHSHGTQVTYPILGGYKSYDGATQLNRSKSQSLSFDYIISTGVGCTNVDMRLNTTPEIYYFTLKHTN